MSCLHPLLMKRSRREEQIRFIDDMTRQNRKWENIGTNGQIINTTVNILCETALKLASFQTKHYSLTWNLRWHVNTEWWIRNISPRTELGWTWIHAGFTLVVRRKRKLKTVSLFTKERSIPNLKKRGEETPIPAIRRHSQRREDATGFRPERSQPFFLSSGVSETRLYILAHTFAWKLGRKSRGDSEGHFGKRQKWKRRDDLERGGNCVQGGETPQRESRQDGMGMLGPEPQPLILPLEL